MKLSYKDIIDKHKGKPCVIAGHGPSIDPFKEQIQKLQMEDKLLRISVNNWFDYFETKPDYWVISNGEFTLKSGLLNDGWWQYQGYPADAYNVFNVPVLFADNADMTDYDLIDQLGKFDYLPYDTRHFKGHTCTKILNNFRKFFEARQSLEYSFYGNNPYMWQPADRAAYEKVRCDPVFMNYPCAAWSKTKKCCHRIDSSRKTLQEELQEYTGFDKHYGTGCTVAVFALSFAILMGCNPIYLAGVDLDYTTGYAKNNQNSERFIPPGAVGHWKVIGNHVLNDFNIVNASAKKKGVKIVNLHPGAWYDSFEKGPLSIK